MRGGAGRLLAGSLGFLLLATGCSSSQDAENVSPMPSSSATSRQTMTSQIACDKFYAFDLFRRTKVMKAPEGETASAEDPLQAYLDLASSAAVSLDSAVTVGDLPPKARVNADRIVRQITLVSKAGGNVRDVEGAVDSKIGRSSERIEALCVATNHPVPQENLDVRANES